MDKTKITNHQLFSITATGLIGGSIIIIPGIVSRISKQDAWIAALITPALGIFIVWIIYFLGSQYTGMTAVGIIKKILGKWVGLVVAVGFVFYFLISSCCTMPWYVADFISTQVMPQTPLFVISLFFLAGVVIALLYGIETIARTSELFIYLVSGLFFLAMILVSPNARIENLQPVLENGIGPILRSTIPIFCFTTFPSICLLMIYPIHLDNMPKAKKSLFKGYLWASLIVFITILMSILVLGNAITSMSQYPTYLLAKEINIGIIFTRLEFLIAAIWIVTEFVICILYLYAGVIGLSELLGLKDYKKTVIPLGLLGTIMSGIGFPDAIYAANWGALIGAPFTMTFGLILPVLLFLVFWIKKGCKKALVR